MTTDLLGSMATPPEHRADSSPEAVWAIPMHESCACEGRLLMASQWHNIHFTTRVDMPEPVSQSLVREADYSSIWMTGQQSALNGIPRTCIVVSVPNSPNTRNPLQLLPTY